MLHHYSNIQAKSLDLLFSGVRYSFHSNLFNSLSTYPVCNCRNEFRKLSFIMYDTFKEINLLFTPSNWIQDITLVLPFNPCTDIKRNSHFLLHFIDVVSFDKKEI